MGLLSVSGLCFGQFVGVKPSQFRKICAEERTANIDLTGVHQLSGSFHDRTGAAFTSKYAVAFRNPEDGRILKEVALDPKGRFSAAQLSYQYINLILVLIQDGKPKRTGFETPLDLHCPKSDECTLDIVMEVGATDQPKDQCPLIQESR
jgi:hypothetical protein